MEVRETAEFKSWLHALRDHRAKGKIAGRIRRMQQGNMGDVGHAGEGLSELRIDFGPGYRVYFIRRGETLVVVLGGGDKDSQGRDIAKAKKLADTLEES